MHTHSEDEEYEGARQSKHKTLNVAASCDSIDLKTRKLTINDDLRKNRSENNNVECK